MEAVYERYRIKQEYTKKQFERYCEDLITVKEITHKGVLYSAPICLQHAPKPNSPDRIEPPLVSYLGDKIITLQSSMAWTEKHFCKFRKKEWIKVEVTLKRDEPGTPMIVKKLEEFLDADSTSMVLEPGQYLLNLN